MGCGIPSHWSWMGNFTWGILLNLYDGGNVRESDFDHSNLFKGQKQHSVNIER